MCFGWLYRFLCPSASHEIRAVTPRMTLMNGVAIEEPGTIRHHNPSFDYGSTTRSSTSTGSSGPLAVGLPLLPSTPTQQRGEVIVQIAAESELDRKEAPQLQRLPLPLPESKHFPAASALAAAPVEGEGALSASVSALEPGAAALEGSSTEGQESKQQPSQQSQQQKQEQLGDTKASPCITAFKQFRFSERQCSLWFDGSDLCWSSNKKSVEDARIALLGARLKMGRALCFSVHNTKRALAVRCLSESDFALFVSTIRVKIGPGAQ